MRASKSPVVDEWQTGPKEPTTMETNSSWAWRYLRVLTAPAVWVWALWMCGAGGRAKRTARTCAIEDTSWKLTDRSPAVVLRMNIRGADGGK